VCDVDNGSGGHLLSLPLSLTRAAESWQLALGAHE